VTGRSSPTPLETASGLVFGVEPPVPESGCAWGDAREALERAVLPALRRPPCIVSFSGGLDSSSVLAVAARVAQREGLPAPIPVTLRFPGLPEADESEWQELVISALQLCDWERLEIRDELSVVGPYATDVLRRHGLLWPFNAYVHAPILDAAKGGALLTGVGGDELLAGSRWDRVGEIGRLRARPRMHDARGVVLALAPRPLRERILRERCPVVLPWLREHAQASLDRLWAAQESSEPTRAASRRPWRLRLRSLRSTVRSLAVIAADRDVVPIHPLVDPGLAAALTRTHVSASRGAWLGAALGDLLPSSLYGRRSKASFNAAFWRGDARALAGEWDDSGVEAELVDGEGLRTAWRVDAPDGRSFLLLQALWLRRAASRAEV
jgi:Asparagine synthase